MTMVYVLRFMYRCDATDEGGETLFGLYRSHRVAMQEYPGAWEEINDGIWAMPVPGGEGSYDLRAWVVK